MDTYTPDKPEQVRPPAEVAESGDVASSPPSAWREEAICRVLTSASFAKAYRLHAFLEYVSRMTLAGQSDLINETRIGVDVFSRDESFNAAEDTIVRTTARLLRQRLTAHYEGEGAGDPVRIQIPKGTYVPVFDLQAQGLPQAASQEDFERPVQAEMVAAAAPVVPWVVWALLLALPVCAVAALFWFRLSGARSGIDPSEKLWTTVFPKDHAVLIVPADTALLQYELGSHRLVPLEEYIDHKIFQPSDADNPEMRKLMESYRDRRYTAATTVQMALEFGRVTGVTGSHAEMRFPRDLQTSDLERSNAVLIGAAQNDPWVGLFRKQLSFHLDWEPAEDRWHVRNDAPKSGEPPEWPWAGTDPARTSYSQIALVHNLGGSGKVLILAGTNMFGSEAAANFLFDRTRMDEVLRHTMDHNGSIGDFEVLLRSNVIGNGTVNTELLAIRPPLPARN